MIINFLNDKDKRSITIAFYINATSTGEILNQQAVIDAISEGIIDESYSDAGLSSITVVDVITGPSCSFPGNEDIKYLSNAASVAIGISVGTVGLVVSLVLILLIFLIKM